MILFAKNKPNKAFLSHLRLLLLFLGGFIFPQKLLSQYRVFGKLTYNNEPVIGATILIKEDSSGVIKSYAISGAEGNYSVIYRGKKLAVFIEVSMVGFKKKFIPLQLGQEREIELPVQLIQSDELLPEVIIKNEAAIMQKGDTTIFKIDSFITGAESSLAKVFEKLPGFIISSSGIISYNGKLISRVLIEGDDLLGRNYQQIIKTLSPNGINIVEVIDNYTDKENITSQQGSETVINLRYISKFLGKISGNLEAAISPNGTFYNLTTQILILKQAAKMLLVSESGNNNINTEEAAHSPGMAETISEATILSIKSFSSIPDVRNNFIVSPIAYKKNSHLPTFTFRNRVSKKILLYGKTRYESLAFRQSAQKLQEFYLFPLPIRFEEQLNIFKDNQLFWSSFSVNYTPNASQQFVLSVALESKKQKGDNVSNIQNKALYESANSESKQIALKAIYNKLLAQGSITIESKINTSRQNSSYKQLNTQFNSFFGTENYLNMLSQPEEFEKLNWRTTAIVRKKIFTYTLLLWTEMNNLKNDIIFANQSLTKSVNKDSITNSSIVSRGLNFTIANRFVKKKFSFEPGIKLQLMELKDRTQIQSNKLLPAKFYVLPQFAMKYKRNKTSQFTLDISSGISDIPIMFIAKGFAVTNLTGLQLGSGALSVKPFYSISAYNSFADLQSKGLFSSIGFTMSNTPLQVISNITTPGFYTYNQYLPSEKNTNSETFFFNATKFSSGFFRIISPSLFVTRVKTFFSTNNLLTKNISLILQSGLKVVSRIKKIDLSANSTVSVINQLNGQISISPITLKKWETAISMDGQLFPGLFFQNHATLTIYYPPSQASQKLFQIETDVNYLLKNKKWQASFTINNITGKNFAETSSIYANHKEKTVYQLFPRVLLLKLKRFF